jgi:polyhydroxyalkanoate synthesis regulator phasin
VNNLLGLVKDNTRLVELETELKTALKGELSPGEASTLADDSLEEVSKLEKEFKENIHADVSGLFHFVNSKIFLAKKIGFDVVDLEEDLDNISSLIARSEYHQSLKDLNELLQRVQNLPKTQDEIMIGLESDSEIISELLEPRAQSVE